MKKQSVYKKALLLAVPMMIQNGITNAVSLVDNLMVGSLGTGKYDSGVDCRTIDLCLFPGCLWRTFRTGHLWSTILWAEK